MKKLFLSLSLIIICCLSTFAQMANVINKNSGLCLAVRGATGNNGEEATQWACDGNLDKNWNFLNLGNGYFKIVNQNSGLFLAVGAGSKDFGGRVVQYQDLGQADIQWNLINIGSEYYKIQNKNSGLFLAVGAGAKDGGANLVQWGDEGQEDIKWQLLSVSKGNSAPAPTKTIEITLNGIFMGECGNPANCHHEPVAGEVHIYLIEKNTGNKIPSTNLAYTLWNSNRNYSLVCDNYQSAIGYGTGSADGFSTPESQTNNIQSALTYLIDENLLRSNQYEWVVRFNLGSAHKDNDFASTGYHWLKEDKGKMEIKMNLPASGKFYTKTIGPYETASNRCHQYWLQFNMKEY